jgi:hypothetical protein
LDAGFVCCAGCTPISTFGASLFCDKRAFFVPFGDYLQEGDSMFFCLLVSRKQSGLMSDKNVTGMTILCLGLALLAEQAVAGYFWLLLAFVLVAILEFF